MTRIGCIFLLLVAGCGDNLTVVDRDAYQPAELEPLPCVPNLDGKIDANEVMPAIGTPVRYVVSPAGVEREVDIVGSEAETGTLWDWSLDLADDQEVVVTPSELAGKWYEASFPPPAFVTPFDASGRVESVLRHDGEALWLLGLASREPSPAEGQTLLVYDAPVALLRFPLASGGSQTSVGTVQNATIRGLPYAGTDTYEVEVDAVGQMELPQLIFTQAHRVRTHVLVQPAVGTATSRRQVSYFFECFAEVARAVSLDDEPNQNFTVASQIWRLGFR